MIVPTVILLNIFGWIYAFVVVRNMRRRDHDHGQTAWLVVVGVGVVVVAYTYITTIEQGILLLALFAAAGIPMIVEYVDDHIDRIHRRRLASFIASLNQEDREP